MVSRFTFVNYGSRALPNRAKLVSLGALFFALIFTATGCIREEDITLDQRAYQLASEIMCPVCDGQTIDQSNAQIATDMRLKVRELVDSGNTNAEVREYFVLRYGQEILAAPERTGFNLIAYIVPIFIVIISVGVALLAIRNMRRAARRNELETKLASGDLSVYLDKIDQDLGFTSDLTTEKKDQSSGQSDEAST